jgi:streptogramin lyase
VYGGENNYRYQNGAFIQQLPNVGINAMSNSRQGQLWISGYSEGQAFIGVYQSGGLEIRYNQAQLPGALGLINQILIDDLDRIWISDWLGNLFVSSAGEDFDQVDLPAEERVSVMEKGPDNKIYLLKGGLFYVVENALSFVQYGSQNSDLSTSIFRKLKVDKNGIAWLQPTGSSYMLIFNPDHSVQRINHIEVNLPQIRINDLFSDHHGDIWMATTNGLRKWEGNAFSEYCTYNSGFKIIDFSRILASGNGDVWSVAKDPLTNTNRLILAQTGI